MADETAVTVKNDTVYPYEVGGHRAHQRGTMDEGYLWMRSQYLSEHGSFDGWAAYCQSTGIITPDVQKGILSHESSLDERLGWAPDNE